MVEATARATWEGRPLSELGRMLELRQRVLGETVRDAAVATAITVLKSLRADTRRAPRKASAKSYLIEDTGWVGGWERRGGRFVRVPRVSSARGAAKVAGVNPVNLAGRRRERGEKVQVWRITPRHGERMTWDRNRNKGCWYVLARSKGVAEDFAKRAMQRKISAYAGLAKTTLGYAMARVSTRSAPASDVKGAKARVAAEMAARVSRTGGIGDFSLRVVDALDYARSALRSGPGAVERAMKKATNSIAGRLRRVASAELRRELATPFPEVRG